MQLDFSTKSMILMGGGIALALVGLGLLVFFQYQHDLTPNCEGVCFTNYAFAEFLGFLILCLGGVGFVFGQNLHNLEHYWGLSKEERLRLRQEMRQLKRMKLEDLTVSSSAEDEKRNQDTPKDDTDSSSDES